MKRTTVSLPDDLAALVDREATRRGTSVSEIVRISLSEQLRGDKRRKVPWAGLVDDRDVAPAAELEKSLSESWADDIAGDR